MELREVQCSKCEKRIVIGFHLVKRFESLDDAPDRVFHAACYDKFMEEVSRRREAIHQKELAFAKARIPVPSMYSKGQT